MAALVFVAMAVAIDRRRAEWLLFCTYGGHHFDSIDSPGERTPRRSDIPGQLRRRASWHLRDGWCEPRRNSCRLQRHSTHSIVEIRSLATRAARLPAFHWNFSWCLVAIAICTLAVLISASTQIYLAVFCGVATLTATIAIRRFRLGPWGYSAIAAVALVAAIAVIALLPIRQTTDWTLAFSARAPASLVAVTQRIAAETRWSGTGAGTFADILPIYQDINEIAPGTRAPTAAAQIAVEMGRPFLWITLLAAIAFVVVLLRGAVRRGRDSCYSNAGSSCAVAATLLALGNAGVFNTGIGIIIAATAGIAIAQSKSRSI